MSVIILDRENDLWMAEMPFRSQYTGYVVLINEEAIGFVNTDTGEPNDFEALVGKVGSDRGGLKSIGGYRTAAAAGRAVLVEFNGGLAYGPIFEDIEDEDEYEAAINNFIEGGQDSVMGG